MSFDRDQGYPAQPERRQLLRAAATLGALPLAGALGDADAAALAFAPAAFDVHDDRALIWLSANQVSRLHVRWGTKPDALDQRSAEVELNATMDYTGHVALTGLPRGATVYYRAFAGDSAVSETGRFNSARKAGQNLTIAFSGDMEEKYKPFRLFDVMAAAAPDYLVHSQHRSTPTPASPSLQTNALSPPTHTHPHQPASTFVASPPTSQRRQPRNTKTITSRLQLAGQQGSLQNLALSHGTTRQLLLAMRLAPEVELIILDTRRFRSVQAMVDGPEKTMLGSAQKQWFFDTLKRSRATWKIVATSVPFIGGSQDASGNYKTERDEVVAFLKRERIDNVVMISADYHFARDWSNKRTGIHEFMAGPIATFRSFDKSPEARERHSKGPHFVFGDDFNFGLLRFDPVDRSLTVSYQDSQGKSLFEQRLQRA